jgi:hypothetical protein
MAAQNVIESWQRKLDALFPKGAVATWMRGSEGANTRYIVEWFQVSGLSGLDPLLLIYARPDRVLGPYQLVDLETVRTKPHYMAKAQFAAQPHALLLCAELPPAMAIKVAQSRAKVIADALPVGLA